MATFFDILPPPQSLDSLDAWGTLDALFASLDDGLWTRAGVYGLSASEKGRAAGTCSAVRKREFRGSSPAEAGGTLSLARICTLAATAGVRAFGSAAGVRIRSFAGKDSCRSRETCVVSRERTDVMRFSAVSAERVGLLRVRPAALAGGQGEAAALFEAHAELSLEGSADARGYEAFSWLRVRATDLALSPVRAFGACALSRDVHLAAQGGAASRGSLAPFRVRPFSASLSGAVAKDLADGIRLRALSGTLFAFGTDFFVPVRVCLVSGQDLARSFADIVPEYKGWMWTEREKPACGPWKAAVSGASDWTPVSAGVAEWQGVVEWQ